MVASKHTIRGVGSFPKTYKPPSELLNPGIFSPADIELPGNFGLGVEPYGWLSKLWSLFGYPKY